MELHPVVTQHPAVQAVARSEREITSAKRETAARWRKIAAAWEEKVADYKRQRKAAMAAGEAPPDPPTGEPDWEFRRSQVEKQTLRGIGLQDDLKDALGDNAVELDSLVAIRADRVVAEAGELVAKLDALAVEADQLRESARAVRRAGSDPRPVAEGPVTLDSLIEAARQGADIVEDNPRSTVRSMIVARR